MSQQILDQMNLIRRTLVPLMERNEPNVNAFATGFFYATAIHLQWQNAIESTNLSLEEVMHLYPMNRMAVRQKTRSIEDLLNFAEQLAIQSLKLGSQFASQDEPLARHLLSIHHLAIQWMNMIDDLIYWNMIWT